MGKLMDIIKRNVIESQKNVAKNILFLSLIDFNSFKERNIYTDLLRKFQKQGHNVYAISPVEKRKKEKTHIIKGDSSLILKLKIGNTQKTNIIEKGIAMVMIESKIKRAIRKYFSDTKFDLILYPTPPITFVGAIEYVKKRDDAKTYLLLKDIFPQNAVDIGLMRKTGIKGLLYKHFRRKEKRLYSVSDRIGCMSKANIDYLLKHNKDVMDRNDTSVKENDKPVIEVCPNSIEPVDVHISVEEKRELRNKYNLPQNKLVFVYGGNLGRPQGIEFMLQCLHSQKENNKAFFLIVGNGTEYSRVKRYIEKYKPKNIALHQWIPQNEYKKVVAACDVGLIFLDHRFTIPNFPSRLLSYMQAGLPVLAVTDPMTDIGKVIVENGFGWWCESDNINTFNNMVIEACTADRDIMGKRARKFLRENYTVEKTCKIILDCLT